MNDLESPTSFSDWLKLRRKQLDLTQEELAQRAGCSIFALRKIEAGERRPSKQLAALLAHSLEIPPADQQTFIRVARGELNLERLAAPSHLGISVCIPELVAEAPPRRLPLPAAPLVGRQPEMSALERLFGDPQCRLLTLTGLGGIGKTRLAVEFASSQLSMFPGGIYYVSLASLKSPDLIIPAIADAFGVNFSGPSEPKEQLLSYVTNLTRLPLLLVLDNLEHLLSPCPVPGCSFDMALLVMEFLQRLPNLKILATSRERLNLQGEWMFELHGLPVPPLGFAGSLDDYGATNLFLLSARRAQADFEIPSDQQLALIRICRMLDGVPLAIELAAAWVGLLSPQEIAHEIAASLDFLSTSMRDVPERHRSIRATFEHSWKLLSDDECLVLQRLSLFNGGFYRQAAEQIVGATLPVLASLHAKSLVRRQDSGRYDLHEVIRQYALAHFECDPQALEVRDRYCEYYLTLLKQSEQALKSAAQYATIRTMAIEMYNVRAAWLYALQQKKFQLIGQALRSFGWLCDIAGWLQEGIEQIEPVIQALRLHEADEEHIKILGNALANQGLLYFRKGQFNQAHAVWQESLAILQPIGDAGLLTVPLIYNGILAHLFGDIAQARGLIEEGLACARAAGDEWFQAYALYNQGYIASLTGHYAEGYEQMLAGLASWRAFGDPSSIALGLNYIAPTAIKLGYVDQAQAYLQESLSLCMEVGDRWGLGTAYRNLGLTALAKGDPSEAQSLIRKSLDIFGEYIVGWDIARSLTYLGDAIFMTGELSKAEEIYLEALRVAVEVRSTPVALDAVVGLARLQLQAGRAERAFELLYYVQNHPAGIQVTRDNADQIILEAKSQLDAPCIEAIEERAQRISLEALLYSF